VTGDGGRSDGRCGVEQRGARPNGGRGKRNRRWPPVVTSARRD
jgi:hypothetical protein